MIPTLFESLICIDLDDEDLFIIVAVSGHTAAEEGPVGLIEFCGKLRHVMLRSPVTPHPTASILFRAMVWEYRYPSEFGESTPVCSLYKKYRSTMF